MSNETNPAVSSNPKQSNDIHPRLCILHKWSHYDGYGIHLTWNEDWRGLHIDHIERNSPAESAGLLREDIVLAINGRSIENEDFFVILSFIQHELAQDPIRFLVLDPQNFDIAKRYGINLDENHKNCIRKETNNTNQTSVSFANEPRRCSITARSGAEPIGISLQADTVFSHVITRVRANSLAARAGIEADDCILFLNDIPLLHISFEDVLYHLAKSRNESKLYFLVAKRSYLLQTSGNYSKSSAVQQFLLTVPLVERNRSSTLPNLERPEQFSSKSADELLDENQRSRRKMKFNEQYDRLSLQIHADSSMRKYRKRLGKILHGIGPVTNLRFPWHMKSEKTTDFSSIQSDLHNRDKGTDERKDHLDVMKENFNPLQVGMTNQSPVSVKRLPYSSILPANSNSTLLNTPSPILKPNRTIQQLSNVLNRSVPTTRIRKQDNQQISANNLYLATIPISEIPNLGYELLHIKLMKPTETIPVGFKLSKQINPLKYVMTLVVEGSKADMAGLHVDDWLIQIEDKDIRLMPLHDVLHNIYQLFNSVGFLDMLIARKIPSKSNEQQTLPSVVLVNSNNDTTASPSTSKQSSIEPNPDKIRRVILKDTSRLHLNSFLTPHNDQFHVHLIHNIQTNSIVHHAGLRNGDRILAVNGTDVTQTSPEDFRVILSKAKPADLTVINDSRYLQSLENQTNVHESITPPPSRNVLFTDEHGPVYVKHSLIQQIAPYHNLGFLLHANTVHMITHVERNHPGYLSGLRDYDIILFVNKKNVQNMTHDDLTILLRSFILTNESVDLITIHKTDLERYQNYRRKRFIDWYSILSKIDHPTIKESKLANEKQRSNTLSDPSSIPSPGERVCILNPKPNRPLGFHINQYHSPPFTICKIEKDSLAEKAGLKLNDTIILINGKSVLQSNYEQIMQTINNARQEKSIEFLVSQSARRKTHLPIKGNSISWFNSNSDDRVNIDQSMNRHQYQKQRMKDFSHAVRLCHLNTTTIDGSSVSSLGFEMTGNTQHGYPMITRVNPKSAGEQGGLQSDDILLKVNHQKTKGVDFDKIQKTIEKAKRNKRLDMLVVDKETFYYCLRANKKFKEPYIRVKHIFPSTKSSITARTFNHPNDFKSESDPSSSMTISDSFPLDISTKFTDPARRLSQSTKQRASSTGISDRTTSNDTPEISTDESIMNFVMNTVNTFFPKNPIDKSNNLDYDVPPERTNASKTHTPLLSTFRPEQHVPKEIPTHAEQSMPSYDYIRDLRRCILEIDREKGLGFILSATGDYDHTITSVDKGSPADLAGLQIYDEIIEINGVDVRSIKYEQVVEMLISAMRMNDSIEMSVVNNHLYSSTMDSIKGKITPNLSNMNNNNNNTAKHMTELLETSFFKENIKSNSLDIEQQSTTKIDESHLRPPLKHLNHLSDRDFSRSVPALSTGITASPKDFRSMKTTPTSNDSTSKVLNIFKNDAPVARLCRIRKFPSSPFYGFFLCGNPKKLGRVFVSNIAKNSSASICGLRDGDHIIEVNGTNIRTLTYETILNIIKLHMEHENLELLVLDKKAARWYHRRKYPITSQTLPTIVHIEPIINQVNSDIQFL